MPLPSSAVFFLDFVSGSHPLSGQLMPYILYYCQEQLATDVVRMPPERCFFRIRVINAGGYCLHSSQCGIAVQAIRQGHKA